MSCSGLYTDVIKSESKVLDNFGWEKLKQSYMKYLGNDLPSIRIPSLYSNSDDRGKVRKNITLKWKNSCYSCIIWTGFTICKDFFRHTNIWQNHQGWKSKVCWHFILNWWNNGPSHWILHHQWSGNNLFCCEIFKTLCDEN